MKLNKGRTLIIGNFEVIHKGHSKLFNKANKPFVYTFKNLPNKKDLPIYSFEQKIQNLLDLNVADIFVLDFKKQNLTANQFI
ncbi:MAG: hypothetical protein K2M43_02745, partial [Mycoplasmoidaceae bacterium]|nr:hypothetical protein [Mycoplasmoidaceae bacterium]